MLRARGSVLQLSFPKMSTLAAPARALGHSLPHPPSKFPAFPVFKEQYREWGTLCYWGEGKMKPCSQVPTQTLH